MIALYSQLYYFTGCIDPSLWKMHIHELTRAMFMLLHYAVMDEETQVGIKGYDLLQTATTIQILISVTHEVV